jgi:hypothetical protein
VSQISQQYSATGRTSTLKRRKDVGAVKPRVWQPVYARKLRRGSHQLANQAFPFASSLAEFHAQVAILLDQNELLTSKKERSGLRYSLVGRAAMSEYGSIMQPQIGRRAH